MTLFAVKINSSLRARVEVGVKDRANNQTLCDPVVANLELKKSRSLTRTFKGLPEHDHYVALQNGAPGLTRARLWVNGKLVSSGALPDGQVLHLNVARWMRPGDRNTVRISVWGPKGGSAVLLIGDATLAGPHNHAAPATARGRKANLEFAP